MKEVKELDITLSQGKSNLIDALVKSKKPLEWILSCTVLSRKEEDFITLKGGYEEQNLNFYPSSSIILMFDTKDESLIVGLYKKIEKSLGIHIELSEGEGEVPLVSYYSEGQKVASSYSWYVGELDSYRVFLLVDLKEKSKFRSFFQRRLVSFLQEEEEK